MEENYYALALAILKPISPERAFQIIYGIKPKREEIAADVEKMIKMKERGMTYKQIGEMFGVSKDTVYTRIRRKTGRLNKYV